MQLAVASSGNAMEKRVIGALYRAGQPLSLGEISELAGVLPRDRLLLEQAVDDLCRRQVLGCPSKKRYQLARREDYLAGRLAVNPRGFGFVTVENPPPNLKIDKDLFIPARELGSGAHGDQVLVRISGRTREGHEGEVLAVLQRGATKLVGEFVAGRASCLVIPEDERFPFNVVVLRENSRGARNGEAVVVEITEYHAGRRNPEGRVAEVLGDPNKLAVQAEITIRNHDLPHTFSPQALEEAEQLAATVEPAAGRTDLRQVLHVTIDGEDAKDFDDAVAIEATELGARLYVSIADVSHYVQPGSRLDKEAYERGTSVYFPGRVVPMLPERLSNNLCSLVPNEDRYTFTAILDFDRDGNRLGKRYVKSLIRSRHRLTYTKVNKMVADNDLELWGQYADLRDLLPRMAELAAKLEKKRAKRGSIGFELPEALIEIDGQERITGIRRRDRNLAHKLIEEFMLAANEAVAETFNEAGMAGLYRIHEEPDAEQIEEFVTFAQTMGLNLPAGTGSPRWFGQVLALVAGKPQEYIINNLLLRSMKQARYSAENVGHFGLAASFYTHFTSPIRRYPDLIVHRVLQQLIGQKINGKAASPAAGKAGGQTVLAEAGDFLSKRERVAVDAEREMDERLKVRFMAEKIGETCAGIISGVSSFGLFVELLDYFVSGAVPLVDMRDDYYTLDDKNHRFIGRGTNRTYQVGDLVTVRVASVELRRRRINFTLADGG